MAKADNVSIFDKHVEKGVLVVCVLVLLYAIVHWGAASPTRIKVTTGRLGQQTEEFSPDKADGALLEVAKRISKKHESQPPEADRPITTLSQIVKLRDGVYAGFVPMVNMGPKSRPLDAKIGPGPSPDTLIKTRLAELQKVTLPPGKPHVRIERELPRKPGSESADITAVRAAAIYQLQKTFAAWQGLLKNQMSVDPIVVIDVVAEVCEQDSSGSWSKPVKVKIIPLIVKDNTGQCQQVKRPRIPQYNGKNEQEVLLAIQDVINQQIDILQPDYWQIWGAEGKWMDWQRHLPESLLKEWGSQRVRIETPSVPARRRPRLRPAAPLGRPTRRRKPVGHEMMEGMEDMMRRNPPRRRTTRTTPPRTARRTRRSAPEMMEGELGSPARRRPVQRPVHRPVRPVRPEVPRPAAVVEYYQVPDFQAQLDKGVVLVWIHDTQVLTKKAYRYRIRLKLLNPLLRHEDDIPAECRSDAMTTAIRTPWSQWSDVVRVPKVTEFFLTGSIPPVRGAIEGKVRVKVFTRSLGHRVEHTFTLTKGQAIGGIVRKAIPNPKWAPGQPDSNEKQELFKMVDFSTGAILVDIDFSKTVLFKGISKPTVQMIYMDDAGKLGTSIVAKYMSSQSVRKKLYDKLIQETKKIVETPAEGRQHRP